MILIISFTSFNFFINSRYKIERNIKIDANIDIVFENILNLEHWTDWAVWFSYPDDLSLNFIDNNDSIITKIIWEGSENNGYLEIVSFNKPDSILTKVYSDGLSVTNALFKLERIDHLRTNLSLIIYGKVPFYMSFMTLFFDSILGNEIEKSLSLLEEKLIGFTYFFYIGHQHQTEIV